MTTLTENPGAGMPKTEVWYCWKEYYEGGGEDPPRLLTPWGDPNEYEYPMDGLFETEEQALAAKKEMAPYETWYLVKKTIEPVRLVEGEAEEE